MPCQRGDLLQGWVLPNNDLILRVAVSANQLVRGCRKEKVTDLRSCVDPVLLSVGECVPKPDRAIS